MNMLADVEDYVRHRDACQVNKVFCSPCLSLAGGSTSTGLSIEAAEGRQRSIYWHKFVNWLSKMVHVTCYPHS